MEASVDKDVLRTAKTEQQAFVLALRDAVGSSSVLGALLTTSKQQWDRCTDANDPSRHLIKGVSVNSVKTDTIFTYIAYIIKQYMVSAGVRATAWTKNTIASDNFTNKSVSNIVAARTFDDHTELFKIVATRLIGFDDAVVDLATQLDHNKKAEILVVYLASRFNMGEDPEEILKRYSYEVNYFSVMFDNMGFTEEYYEQQINKAIAHFDNTPADGEPYNFNHFSLLTATNW